ncbi:MAG: HD domain-containing protein [Anaerolineales bacterium]|nr:HD domain-containing protein [Anaerolineales bacterium]
MEPIAARLTPAAFQAQVEGRMTWDAAHDWFHIERVFAHGLAIAATEPSANAVVLRSALILHDLGAKQTGGGNALLSTAQIAPLLAPFGVDEALYGAVVAAINEHSFSRGLAPTSLEAAILQDADRLDAIGAIGIARAFAFGGACGLPLYDPQDQRSTIHHFYDKLLRLCEGMHTAEGQRLAALRHRVMQDFLNEFHAEWQIGR